MIVTPDGMGGYDYVYQYRDHLGNVRLSYTDANGDGSIDPATEIIEENNYYPFGLEHKGYNDGVSPLGNSTAQRWKFGGKEFDESFNGTLNTYDFGARNYDPALGRWMNIDPLAEQMRRHSPYNFAFNSPVSFIDPDGMAPFWIQQVNDDGSTSLIAEAGDSAASLADQFDIDINQAERLTGTIGNEIIKTGTKISGEEVAAVNGGNEVLELVLGKASPQDVLNQFVFASDYSQLYNDGIIDTGKFFENIFGGSMDKWTGAGAQTGSANLEVEGGIIGVELDLRIFSGEPKFNGEWSNFIDADLYTAGQRPDGTMAAKFKNYRQISPTWVGNSDSQIITKNNGDFLKLEKRFDRFKK